MKRVKINYDGFVWHVRTEAEAKQLFGEQTLYALYDDDTEAEIENEEELEAMFRRGIYVGTEVGFIDDNLNKR